MQNNILVSVVVPVYNVEKYLSRCIDSISRQSYSNLQIILVDDGSKDNSAVICDEYSKKDTRISVIHKTNGGLSDARNVGIDNAKGDYICFIDSDDFVRETYVEDLLNAILKYNSDIAVCLFEKGNSDKFNEVAKDILDDEFCSNIELSTMRTDLAFRNQVVKMNIYSGSIHICLENILKMQKPVILSYYADKDEINLKKEKGILREYDVNRLLGVLVTKGAFPSYHRNLIDSSCDKNVDVVMNQSLSTSCNFDIIEESDKFVLQKKKKNYKNII